MQATTRRSILAGLAAVTTRAARAQQAAPNARDLVASADRVRNPDQPFRLTSTLVEYVGGKPRDRVVLTVFAREDAQTLQYRNLIRYAEPPRDTGKLVLLSG